MVQRKHALPIVSVRLLSLACALLALLVSGLSAKAFAAGRPERKLTILVYMCGSNLESTQGAASADIQEMLDSGVGSPDVALLVMAGGTDRWFTGFDPEKNTVVEISRGHQRIVRQTEKKNMGSRSSLEDFLSFAAEQYPAREYALILWDHGGGPLGGICWDELFSMSHLSLPDLTRALEFGCLSLGRKLSWIGFDACLMSSLEVAAALSPYADYMVASQEMEPGCGWNYTFLTGIENDPDPAATGVRIVDSYFAGQEDSGDILTLACTDLAKAAGAAEALGDYFGHAEAGITAESFPALSGLRMSSAGFGKGLRGVSGDDGYDLVDARDLVDKMPWDPEKKQRLLQLLEDAVVCSRSNQETACGLTLYHPYSNKSKYLSDWKNNYRSMNLIPGYTRYVQSFGSLLTADELVRWQDLQTRADGVNRDGTLAFSAQLTEEQASHFISGQLLILASSVGSSSLKKSAGLVSVVPAVLGPDGLLTAAYDQSFLYYETEDGTQGGPLTFTQTDDGACSVVRAVYLPLGEYHYDHAGYMLYYLDANDSSRYPSVIRTRVWDEATQSYSSRLALRESDYRMVEIYKNNCYLPEAENGVLPDFFEWKNNPYILSRFPIPLPNQWRFVRVEGQVSGTPLFALFRITDSQQNTVCSLPVSVENPNHTPFDPVSADVPEFGCALTLSGYVDRSDNQKVRLLFSVNNHGTEEASFQFSQFVLNDERQADSLSYSVRVPAGETASLYCDIRRQDLFLLDEISSVSFQLRKGSLYDDPSVQVRMETAGCSLQGISSPESMGRSEQDGILMDVLSLGPHEDGGFACTLLVRNHSGRTLYPRDLILNDLGMSAGAQSAVLPGQSCVYSCWWKNGLQLDNWDLVIPGETNSLYYTWILNRQLESRGEEAISKVSLVLSESSYSDENPAVVSVPLNQSWPVREAENPGGLSSQIPMFFLSDNWDQAESVPVADSGRWTAALRGIVLGESQVLLVLDVTNRTDALLTFTARDFYLNHGAVGDSDPNLCDSDSASRTVSVVPGSTRTVYLSLSDDDGVTPGMEVNHLSFLLYALGDRTASSAVITLREPAAAGGAGPAWISAGRVDVVPVEFSSASSGFLPETFPVPDHAAGYLRWIEAPLTEEELSLAESIEMYLVLPVTDTVFVPVTGQLMGTDETNINGVWFPGLVACTRSDETNYIPLMVVADEISMTAKFQPVIHLLDGNALGTVYYDDVRIVLDYSQNTGRVSPCRSAGGEPDLNSDQLFAFWDLAVMEAETGPDGRFNCLQDMKLSADWTARGEETVLSSLQIVLRPVKEEDGFRFLFSVRNKDGTGYSFLAP